MTQYLHIVMDLNGEKYTPELNDDQMTDVAVTAKDIAVGEWPGSFVQAARIDYASASFEDVTADVLGVIEAVNRAAA